MIITEVSRTVTIPVVVEVPETTKMSNDFGHPTFYADGSNLHYSTSQAIENGLIKLVEVIKIHDRL